MDMRGVALEREDGSVASGTQLGSKYFLGEPIGRGAMGVVYDATSVTGETLAIKLLRPELASDDKTVARFVQERQIFRRIEHPNVVRVHDLVAEGDQLGIAMDKVDGGDLRQRIEGGALAPSVAMKIAADIAGGLEAIHAADVVHRDLKPANILIAETAEGLQPRISDFGISKLVSEAMTRTSSTIGTPLYMAPEAADKRGAESPADIYSLGAMMFELLIGAAPFHEGGTIAVLLAHAQNPPPFVGGVPPALAELIDQMLAKQPSDRPSASTVRNRLLTLIPTIEDSVTPTAIERDGSTQPDFATPVTAAGAGGVDVGQPADRAGDGTGDEMAQTAMFTGVDQAGLDSEETKLFEAGGPNISGDPQNSADQRISGDPRISGDSRISGDPGDSSETIFDPGLAAAPAASPIPGQAPPPNPAPTPVTPAPTPAPVSAPVPPASGAGSVLGDDRAPTGPVGIPAAGGAASMVGGERAGGGPAILDERPRRLTEIVLAVASLVIVASIVGYLVLRDNGDDVATGDDGTTIAAEADPDGEAGDADEGSSNTSPESNDNGGSGPGIFDGGTGDGDDSDGDADPTPTTADNPEGPTTVKESTTASTAGSTTSTEATSSTSTSSTATSSTTTTTEPTTTTESTTTTTTITTAPTATPIAIVTGISVDSVGPTQFHFNYSTNDVCGTGSFSVVEKSSGTTVGSYTGGDICYGPLHGGFPGHSSFPGFNLQPNTTYNVFISVRGTAAAEGRAAGSGTATKSFQVTTSG